MVNNSLLWQEQIGFSSLRTVNQPFYTNNILCHDHRCVEDTMDLSVHLFLSGEMLNLYNKIQLFGMKPFD